MTDTEQKIIKEICKVAHIDDISDLSDGYHTFRQLYYQRMMLFAALVKQNRDKAWKSIRHEDGELCFGGGWFIVGIDTPEGSYTYHYNVNYFSLFDCVNLERGKHWDGHTEKDVTRLLSLEHEICTDAISRRAVLNYIRDNYRRWFINDDAFMQCMNGIKDIMISVTSAEKAGHWISLGIQGEIDGQIVRAFTCSECGAISIFRMASGNVANGDLCPNCRSKMQEAKEE